MLKLITASIARTIQKVRKKPRAVVVPIVGVAILMAAAISSVGFERRIQRKSAASRSLQ